MAAWWLWGMLGAAAAADIAAVGVLKQPAEGSACRSMWLMSTQPRQPAPLCLQVAGLPAPLRALLDAHIDQEVGLEGVAAEGAVIPTRLHTALGDAGGTSLDFHVTALDGTPRSFNVGQRLLESSVPRIRLQTPQQEPVSIELIFQGVRTPERLDETLARLRFLVGDDLTPVAQRSGGTLVLLFPPIAPQQLFVFQAADGGALAEILLEGLYGGDRERLSVTLLLSPLPPG